MDQAKKELIQKELGKISKVIVLTRRTATYLLGHTELILVGENKSLRCSYGGKMTLLLVDKNLASRLCSKDTKEQSKALFDYSLKFDFGERFAKRLPLYLKPFSKAPKILYGNMLKLNLFSNCIDTRIQEISPLQGEKMLNKAFEIADNPKSYDLLYNNCTTNARKILKAGLETKGLSSSENPIIKLLNSIPVLAKGDEQSIIDRLDLEKKIIPERLIPPSPLPEKKFFEI